MKKAILLITIGLLTVNVFSQVPNWQWAKGVEGIGGKEGSCVATDASGNIYMIGIFGNSIIFGIDTLTDVGDVDMFIVKYDVSGNVLWAKSAGGNYSDYANSVATDVNGNVYVTGYYGSTTIIFGTDTLTNSTGGSYDLFIAKYDALGNVLWAKSAGGTSYDVGVSVSTDVSGNVYMVGNFDSPTITFGTDTLTNAGVYNLFIVKYDPTGSVLWTKCAGGTSEGNVNSVSTDANGNAFITGYFTSPTITFGTITLINSNTGYDNIFIVKYDASGNVLWAKSVGGAYNVGYSVSTDAIGNVFMTGYFFSTTITFGTVTLTKVGGYDTYIVKYDATGNVLWAKSGGGINSAYSYCVATDLNGNAFITGKFHSPSVTFGGITLTNAGMGSDDLFIVKYDSSGNVVWATSVGGPADDVSNSVCTDASGNVYLTGNYISPTITFGTTTLTNADNTWSRSDVFIAKLNGTTGVVEIQNGGGFIIAPNPFTSQTTISFNQEQTNTTLYIRDVLGREINKITFSGKQCVIEKGTMQAGIYFVQIMDANKKVMNRKVVVQ